MSVPKSKSELLDAINGNYQKLRVDLDPIPDRLTRVKNLTGHRKGTTMSICNLVAYLIGWGELVLKWHKKKDRGEVVDFPETGFKWTELGQLAQKFYSDYETEDFKMLLRHLERVHGQIVQLVESKDDVQLYGSLWSPKCTMGKMIQLNTASPYRNALGRIRRWKREHKLPTG